MNRNSRKNSRLRFLHVHMASVSGPPRVARRTVMVAYLLLLALVAVGIAVYLFVRS